MRITVKLQPGTSADTIIEVVHRSLNYPMHRTPGNSVVVERLFPDADTGNRARMYSVELPDSFSNAQMRNVLDALQHTAAIEYVEIPSVRRAI
jgi:hypothetical protein